jgi:hypothetical protein
MPDDTGLLQALLKRAITPLTTAPTDLANKRAMEMTNPTLGESRAHAMANGFGAGALQGIGKIASGMTSPFGLATLAAGPVLKGAGLLPGAAADLVGAAAPAAETLGEVSPEFTAVGGEGMFNMGRGALSQATDPAESAYQAILARGGR